MLMNSKGDHFERKFIRANWKDGNWTLQLVKLSRLIKTRIECQNVIVTSAAAVLFRQKSESHVIGPNLAAVGISEACLLVCSHCEIDLCLLDAVNVGLAIGAYYPTRLQFELRVVFLFSKNISDTFSVFRPDDDIIFFCEERKWRDETDWKCYISISRSNPGNITLPSIIHSSIQLGSITNW